VKEFALNIIDLAKGALVDLYNNIQDINYILQLAIVAALFFVSLILYSLLKKKFVHLLGDKDSLHLPGKVVRFFRIIFLPGLCLISFVIARNILNYFEFSMPIIRVAIGLIIIWLSLKIVSAIISNNAIRKIVVGFSWTAAIIFSVGLMDETVLLLNNTGFTLVGIRVTAYAILSALFALLIFGWLAKLTLGVIERRINTADSIKPSLQVLFVKIAKITTFGVVFFIVISNLGIDLTTFAFVTGAIGIGVGFGLQKVISNLISGVILLLDESIKPGDIIEVDDTFGRVQEMSSRYTSVVDLDGREFLVPNENIITNKLINWSHKDKYVRAHVNVGVSYSADVNRVMEILNSIPARFPRILKNPNPVSYLIDFGDNSINFRLCFWITDPEKGLFNVKSDLLVAIWQAFKDNDVEIPFPQRDVYIKKMPAGILAD